MINKNQWKTDSSIWSWNFHLFYRFHYLNISFQNDTVKPKFYTSAATICNNWEDGKCKIKKLKIYVTIEIKNNKLTMPYQVFYLSSWMHN